MNKKTLAALVVVLCALGAILYFATRSDDASAHKRSPGDDAAVQADNTGPKRLSSKSPTTGPSAQPPEIAQEPDPEGPLQLEGQVLDEHGDPVGGAKVWINSNPPRTVDTEQDGSFAFDKLIGKVYWVTAKKGARVGGPVERKLTASSEPVVISLELGSTVAVTVTSKPDDKPIEGATVTMNAMDSATTDASGVARFEGVRPGYASLSASARGFAPTDSWMEVADNPGNELTHAIQLSRGAVVAGKVVDPDNKPVSGAVVVPVDSTRVYRAQSNALSARTNDEGVFTIPAIAAGTWTLQATHKNFAPGSSDLVTLDGKTHVRDIVIQLEPGAIVAGRVMTADHSPAPWASVRVQTHKRSGGGFGAQVRSTTADENGAFEMTGLPRRTVQVLAMGEVASSRSVDVDLETKPETRGLELILDVTGKIAGIVVDSAGEPIAEAQVTAAPDFWSGESIEDLAIRGQAQRTTDGGGRFEFSGLPDGKYRVQASRNKTAAFWWTRPHGKVVDTGTTDVELVVEKEGALTGKVVIDNGDIPRSFTVEVGYPPAIPIANRSGEFSIAAQVPGTYDVTISGLEFSEYVVRGVQIEPGKTKDLGTIRVERGRFVTGRVTDSSGRPVPGATVAVARQLIGDGTSIAPELGASTEQALGMRRARTDGDGEFRIVGIGHKKQVLAAEHPELGRSLPVEIPAGDEPVEQDLELRGFGTVVGTITSGGKPAANIQVAATPAASSQQNIVVTTGADGKFRYDKLTEGTYTIMGVVNGGIGGGNFASKRVEVEASKVTEVDIDIAVGDVVLTVGFEGKDGAKIDSAQIFWFSEPGVDAATAEQITKLFTSSGGNAKSAFIWSADKPAELEDLVPGDSTLCALPINGSLLDQGFVKRLQSNLDKVRVYCEPLTIAPSPKEQSHTVVVPPMDPLPAPE